MKRMWLVVSLAVLAVLAGCAVGGGGEYRGMDDPGTSLVFGYIDMAEAPTTISGASIVQVWPPSDKPDWGANARHGAKAALSSGSCRLPIRPWIKTTGRAWRNPFRTINEAPSITP